MNCREGWNLQASQTISEAEKSAQNFLCLRIIKVRHKPGSSKLLTKLHI
jgi:hypothetical protein